MTGPAGHNETFTRVVIDGLLRDVGWNLTDGVSVRYEQQLSNKTKPDYLLCDRHGRTLAIIEAKRPNTTLGQAEEQAKGYAQQLKVPFVFLANGEEILFWDVERQAHPRPVATFYGQQELERRTEQRQLRLDPMTVPIDDQIAGRDYQGKCIDAVCTEWNRGRRKMLVEMATGTGKTRTAAALIKRLFEARVVTRVLFLVDRITLAKQTEDAFAEHLTDLPAYVLRTGRRFQDEKLITVTTLQSMINIYSDYSAGYFDLVVTDECHRSIYGQWAGVLRHFDAVQVGLTATPLVGPEQEEGDDEDRVSIRDTLRFFEVDAPTYRYTLKEAVNDGYLVPYQIYKAKTVKTAAEGGFPIKRGEIPWDSLDPKTHQELTNLFGAQEQIMLEPSALERRFTIPARNLAMVQEFKKVMAQGYQDRYGMPRKPLIGKTIVFAVTKRHAETLAKMIDDAFADQKPDPSVRYADFVVSGCGPDNTLDAAAKIRRFKKEKFPQVLVSVNMLDTGFDAPDVVNLVMARFTKSVVLYRQMRGRGTRKAPGKSLFTMFDFVGVSDWHDDNDDFGPGGVVVAQPKKGPYNPKKIVTLDVDDQIDPTTREWITVDDNGNFVFLDADQEQAATLGMRFETWLLEQSNLDADQTRLLRGIGEYLKANAKSATGFTPNHFFVPPFSNQGGISRALQVFGGEEPLKQVLASLNQALFDSGWAMPESRPSAH